MESYKKIYMDPDEPLNALLNKIKGEQGDGLIIIIHKQSPIFSGQINIELIKKYSQRCNKELIFITNIKKIENILLKAGFKVYAKLEDIKAESLREQDKEGKNKETPLDKLKGSKFQKRSKKRKKRGGRLKNKLILFFAFFILATLSWVYFALANIEVEVAPVSKEMSLISEIIAVNNSEIKDKSLNNIDLIEQEVNFRKDISIETTGARTIGYKSARGIITIINDEREEVRIPKGTLVATRNGTRFRTLRGVVVPAARVERFMDVVIGIEAGRNEVEIEAVEKGAVANVSPGRITEFVNSSYSVRIINSEPTRGGEDRKVRVVSDEDLERALEKARRESLTEAEEKLVASFGPSLIFFKDNFNVSSQSFNARGRVGDIRDELVVESKVKINGFAIEKEGLKDLVFKLYNEGLKGEFILNNPQISIRDLRVDKVEDGRVEFVVESTGLVQGNIDSDIIIDKIVGKSVEDAKELLDGMSQIESYRIRPDNQVNLPQFRFGINLTVDKD
ncbi:baseplate J/gp47 family protein [Halonatronum saccharophilum]|uniref:baseplate J/gp47 family protein n=1 Tax=Halonatronum saccharophilum TaxID=150060 RepID=UPI00048378FB|nr:baseplate J/gp47 family protein [Halonatronum saccharophilum]